MDAGRTVAKFLFALFLCAGGDAHAHRVEFPKRDTLRVARDRLTLQVEYVVQSADEARVLRQLFDRDRSGSLDAQEQRALLAHLARQATAFVKLEFDGKPLELHEERAQLGGDGASVDILLSALLKEKPDEGRHHLRVRDRHKDRRIAVPLRIFGEQTRVVSPLPPLPLLDEDHAVDFDLEISARSSR